LTIPQVLKTCAEVGSLDSCNQLLRGGLRFCCDALPAAHFLRAQRQQGQGVVQQIT
jgi:hypothetical protein